MISSVAVGDIDPQILIAEERLRAAQLAADIDELDHLIADDLLFTGPDGRLATKQEDLDAHGSGVVRFRANAPEELRARQVAPNVIATSLKTRIAVEVQGSLVEATVRYTRVWTRHLDGRWQVAAGHVSEVRTDG